METPRAGQPGEPPDVLLRETGEVGEAVEASLEVQATETAVPVPAPPREVIRLPVRHNHLLGQLLRRVNADVELLTLWRCANINAVDRSGISDHGPVHIQVVSNIALKLGRLLFASGIEPSCVRHHGLTVVDAELIVVLAVLLHERNCWMASTPANSGRSSWPRPCMP
jgi:hypothetical protein